MTEYPLVSVVIASYNGKHLLKTCLDSVFKQTYRNYEVILVDNGSSDDSVEFVGDNYPLVKIIKNKQNVGNSEGFNVGIEISKGKYIATLDNDTRVRPDWIENLVKVAEMDDKIGICGSRQLNFYQPNLIDSTGMNLYRGVYPSNRGNNEVDNSQFDEQVEVFGAPGASAFYKKEMLNQIGLFDSDFFLYQEEFDLCWRANLLGWRCVYVPKAVSYHIGGATSGAGSKFVRYYMERNRILTIVKNLPFTLFLQYLPFLLKYELDILSRVLTSFQWELITARLASLKLIPRMLRKRVKIQKAKVISNRQLRRFIKIPR
jgi:hypothetical protein